MKEIINKLFEEEAFVLEKHEKKKLIDRNIINTIEWDDRIVWLIWLRWVWKTTILLNRRTKVKNSIYLTADRLIFNELDFFELVKEMHKTFWIVNFFIDEIHHLKDYAWILKNIYDLLPVNIVFSWSNMINLLSSKYDLSRRVVSYNIPIFSFKEFLLFKYEVDVQTFGLKYLLENHIEISRKYSSKVSKIIFEDYLILGQFWYFMENERTFQKKLENSIKKSIYNDLAELIKVSTENLRKMEEILLFFANTVQDKITIGAISKKINIHPTTVENYINFLVDLGWIIKINKYWTITDSIRKEKKMFFSNTNISRVFQINENSMIKWNMRENFFISCFNRVFEDLDKKMYFKTRQDFVIKHNNWIYDFEIGWKGKWKEKYEDETFIIKDDILVSEWNKVIPLWLFGLLEK